MNEKNYDLTSTTTSNERILARQLAIEVDDEMRAEVLKDSGNIKTLALTGLNDEDDV